MVAVVWGRGNWRAVDGVAGLDALLADLESTSPGPQMVGLYPQRFLAPDFVPGELLTLPSLQLGIGHPVRGLLYWTGPDGGLGYESALPAWPVGVAEIAFDYGGDLVVCGPDRASVTPAAVRDAALEYATTGTRPTRVRWRTEGTSPPAPGNPIGRPG